MLFGADILVAHLNVFLQSLVINLTNLKFPKKARKENVTGDVVVEFVIEKDGSVGDVNITTSLTPECDQAVVDMVKKMPKWTPARKDNKDVRSLYTMPVSFKFVDGSTPAAPQQ